MLHNLFIHLFIYLGEGGKRGEFFQGVDLVDDTMMLKKKVREPLLLIENTITERSSNRKWGRKSELRKRNFYGKINLYQKQCLDETTMTPP